MRQATATSSVQIEGPHVRVTRWDLPQGASTGPHVHEVDYVVVPVSNGIMHVTLPDGQEQTNRLQVGAAYERPAGTEHDVRNDDPETVSFVEVELLEHPQQRRTG